MTIPEQTPVDNYVGDGVQDTFAFNFRILQNSDVVVTVNDILQVESSDYDLANVTELGGDVVFQGGSIPADSSAIKLQRETDQTQEVDYNPFDPFPAETHEFALDKLTMLVQELAERSDIDLSNVLSLDPSLTFWEAETKRIKNLVQPQDPNDATTKQYVDDQTGSGFDPTVDRLITGEWEFALEIIGKASENTANADQETITGDWGFVEKLQIAGGAILGYQEFISSLNSAGDTELFLLGININNFATIGSAALQGNLISSTHMVVTVGGATIMDMTDIGLVLENSKRLSSRNAADNADITIATVDNADLVIIGSQSQDLRLQAFSFYDLRINGITIMAVDVNKFNPLIDVLLLNGKALMGRNQANDADLNLAKMDNDFALYGDPDAGVIIDSSSLGISLNHESEEIADTVALANGGLRVVDRNSQKRKAGFRDATTRNVTGTPVLIQSDEDSFVQCDSVTTEIHLEQMEQDTQITLVNRQNTSVDLIADGSLTGGIEFFDGQGSFPTGNRTIAGGSVVHIRYRDSVSVSIWGNGIT